MSTTVPDYAQSGLTIQYAMLDHVRRFPNKAERPDHILWGGLHIKTFDVVQVPERGVVRAQFVSAQTGIEQGFDLKLRDGWLELEQGERIPHLRTWIDERFNDVVEYQFFSRDGQLWVWNVYKMKYPGGQVVEEKWTENAGFWVERTSENERVYHCSHGMATPPDFECLVFALRVSR